MPGKFDLPDHLTSRVEARLKAGQFADAAAVLEAGLNALDEQETRRRAEQRKLDDLREALGKALADPASEDGEAVFARLTAKHGLSPVPA